MKIKATPRSLERPIPGGKAGSTVTVEPLRIGQIHSPAALFDGGTGRAAKLKVYTTPRGLWRKVPVPAFLIRHPTFGPFVVDTGLHPSVSSSPKENLGRAISSFGRPELEPGEDLPAQLRARGIEPRAIPLVVMTHLHLDHASGMAEFPSASFVLTDREWEAATEDNRPLLRGYRHEHYDYAFDYRTVSYDGPSITSYSTFGRTFDLFGDGSVRLASTPGHSLGHQSVICHLSDRDLVIAGDAVYTYAQLEDGDLPPKPADPHTFRRSLQELRHFHRQFPQAVIIPGHDAEAWEQLDDRYE
ncbi:N-acyl homoserine lactonase family protein [soil metagenome]